MGANAQAGGPICAPSGLTNASGMLGTPQVGPVAQWLEQGAHNALVGGSSPSGPTTATDLFCLMFDIQRPTFRKKLV